MDMFLAGLLVGMLIGLLIGLLLEAQAWRIVGRSSRHCKRSFGGWY